MKTTWSGRLEHHRHRHVTGNPLHHLVMWREMPRLRSLDYWQKSSRSAWWAASRYGEQQCIRDEHHHLRQDMSQILVTASDMEVAMTWLEKRPVETEMPIETSKSEPVPPPPLGMPVGARLCAYIGGDQDRVVWPRLFVVGESSSSQEAQAYIRKWWDVFHFLKCGWQLFIVAQTWRLS